jgi:hypothetical protein
MVSALITTTTIPTEPGVYGKITATGASQAQSVGVVAIVARASMGPLNTVVECASPQAVKDTFGPASAVDRTNTVSTVYNLAREAAIGGALKFEIVRVGSGGTVASRTLVDGAAANVGSLAATSPGVFFNGLTFSIRAVTGDATQKELVVFNGAAIIQQNRFPAASGDEPGGLQTATATAQYLKFTKTGTGNGVLAAVTNATLNTVPGVDPTISNGDYTTAFALLSPVQWATLVTDSEASAVHTALQQYLDTEVASGRFRTGAVGEPTSVGISSRRADASALNSALIRYIGNGVKYPNGDGTTRNIEGYLAAAEQAGRMSTLEPGHSMTWRTISGATGIIDPIVDKASAINAGMGYYEFAGGSYRTGSGISTLVTPGSTPIWAIALHDGWKKLEHTITAFGLISQIGADWDEVVADQDVSARPPNTAAGRAALVAIANRTTKFFIDRGWLQSGECIVDPGHPPTSDVAFFTFTNLKVALRAERLVIELPFAQP